jgi:hypothetical protein
MGELEKTIAVVFRRSGKNILSEREFVMAILGFRWTSSKGGFMLDAGKAQQVLDAGLAQGLLVKQEGIVKPTFDIKDYDVPLNYKPTEAILTEFGSHPPATNDRPAVNAPPTAIPQAAPQIKEEAPPIVVPAQAPPKPAAPAPVVTQSLFSRLVDEISKASGLKRQDVVARINKVQEKLGTESIVAALAVARDNGIDIGKYLKEAKEEIVKS